MIQRIQSVYLLLGALSVLGLLLVDGLWDSAAVEAQPWYGPSVIVLGALVAIVALVAIFLYKDRKQQRTVIVGLQGLTVLFLLVLFGGLYLSGTLNALIASGISVSLIVLITLPVLAYLFFYLARRGVDADIALVRSMDRLR